MLLLAHLQDLVANGTIDRLTQTMGTPWITMWTVNEMDELHEMADSKIP